MALGDAYCTVPELAEYCQIGDGVDDDYLARVAGAISNGIEAYCHRQFNDAGAASARVFYPDSPYYVAVDDFHTVTGLVVKTGDSFATTLTDYTLEPLNGVQHGRAGFPWRKVRLHAGTFATSSTRRPTVQVTARWGWSEVPDDIRVAALMQAARKFRRRYSPSGVQTLGSGDLTFTTFVSRIDDPDVMELLRPFKLPAIRFC